MTENNKIRSRFSYFPNQLKKLLYLFGALIILNIVIGILLWPHSYIFVILTIFMIFMEWGIYRLKPWARTISILVLGIAAFFAAFRLIYFVLGLIGILSLAITFGSSHLIITFVLSYLLYPGLVFYLLYLISNDEVKQYFDYPEMVERSQPSPRREKAEKEYKSFGSVLD